MAVEEELLLRYATQWRLVHKASVATGQEVHIAEAPESMRSFCGKDCADETFLSAGASMCGRCVAEARAQKARVDGGQLVSAEQIARELGMASAAVARGWLRRAGVRHIRRQPGTDAKLYDPEQVRRARDAMPGKGARTDLHTHTEEPAMTVTATDLRNQVIRFLEAGDHGDDYDVDGIIEAIRGQHGLVDIGSIDAADFNAILAANDTTA